MLVGSMQAASKNAVTHGETKKYGGLIFTKNIDPTNQKMPDKVIQGRLTWLNVRKCLEYEQEEIGEGHMRQDRPIYSHQVTARLTNDLIDRVDHIAEDKMIPRGAWIRNAILKCVREEEGARNTAQPAL